VQSGLRLDNPLWVATLQRLSHISLDLGDLCLGALFGLLKRDALGILRDLPEPGIFLGQTLRETGCLVPLTGRCLFGPTLRLGLGCGLGNPRPDTLAVGRSLLVIEAPQIIVVVSTLRGPMLVSIIFRRVVDNLDDELRALFVSAMTARGGIVAGDLLLSATHARITARGSSTVPSTVSSLISRNSWPSTVKRVPE
jgi:hypothetical protein